MTKKQYQAPRIDEVNITLTHTILEETGNEVLKTDGNSGIKYGGKGHGAARGNERNNQGAEWGNLW